jgi:hypothetical protein
VLLFRFTAQATILLITGIPLTNKQFNEKESKIMCRAWRVKFEGLNAIDAGFCFYFTKISMIIIILLVLLSFI